MSTFTLSIRRRDLAWGVALIALLTTTWIARSDIADAGGSPPPGEGIALVYVAAGANFPDSLGVGPGAGANGAPIIILPTNPPIPALSEAELVRLDPRTVIIIGGTSAISGAMEDALEALLPNATVSRIGGANRYDTNAMYSTATFPVEGWASISYGNFNDHAGFAALREGGIQLPQGAEILEFVANVHDGTGSNAIEVDLIRVDQAAITMELAHVETTVGFNAGVTTISDSTITSGGEIIDNETYAYYVQLTSPFDTFSGVDVVSVMVKYRLGATTG